MHDANYIFDLDFSILKIEEALENIFNGYKNDDFEEITPAVFIYKNSIKFVPIEIKDLVEKLLDVREKLMELKILDTVQTRKRAKNRW